MYFQVGFVFGFIIDRGNDSVCFGDNLYQASFKQYIDGKKMLELVSVPFPNVICVPEVRNNVSFSCELEVIINSIDQFV